MGFKFQILHDLSNTSNSNNNNKDNKNYNDKAMKMLQAIYVLPTGWGCVCVLASVCVCAGALMCDQLEMSVLCRNNNNNSKYNNVFCVVLFIAEAETSKRANTFPAQPGRHGRGQGSQHALRRDATLYSPYSPWSCVLCCLHSSAHLSALLLPLN